MIEIVLSILSESWQVLGQMAPYLLFGFLMAGLLSVYLSPAWLERNLGGRSMGPVWRAALFGVPLPLCSCSVIPVSVSLRRHGAGRAATTAFLLSTPQTGVDSILVTHAMLGPLFAIYRPVAAFLTGLVGGGLVLVAGQTNAEVKTVGAETPDGCDADCCATAATPRGKLRSLFRYGFLTLPRDIGRALLVGVLIAGVMGALVPADRLEVYIGGGVLSILIMMLVGVPVYVCATASVPIAAGFIHVGASAGAALAFLIAGPATNAATITTLWKVLGRRTAVIYLFTVAISAVICGLLLDWLLPRAEAAIPQLGTHVHGEPEGGWQAHVWAVLLLGVLAFSYLWRPGRTDEPAGVARATPLAVPNVTAAGETLELAVQGMSCHHCAESIRQGVAALPEVQRAEVDLVEGKLAVAGEKLDANRIVKVVRELGYTAQPLARE